MVFPSQQWLLRSSASLFHCYPFMILSALSGCFVGLKRGCKKPEGSFFNRESWLNAVLHLKHCADHHQSHIIRASSCSVCQMEDKIPPPKTRCLKDMITHWVTCVHTYRRTRAQSSFHHVRKSVNLKVGLSLSSEVPTDGGSILQMPVRALCP